MEDKARFAVGLDIGTNTTRAVVGTIDREGKISVIGYGESPTEGMRRGIVKELMSPPKAIDVSLAAAEGMSGYHIEAATVNINGAHIGCVKVDGMVAVGVGDHEIDDQDIDRIIDTAIAGKVPQNREILALVPYEYILDGQGGIREPYGMHGSRLEIRASAVSAMTPDCDNVQKICEASKLQVRAMEPCAMAAARAVITNRQKENGVGVVDMGGSTTSVAIYDEGELQFTGVVPFGSNDITNDLATVLKTVPDIAEEIKVRFASGRFGETDKDIVIKRGRDEYTFRRKEVDEVVEARLEEIFEGVRKLLKHAGYDKRLPEGLVLVGGGAKLRDLDVYVREQVELAVRVAKPEEITGLGEDIKKPEWATVIGLMIADAEHQLSGMRGGRGVTENSQKKTRKAKKGEGFFAKLFKKLK